MKIGKFVAKKPLKLDNNDIALCIDKFQGTKFNLVECDSPLQTRIYSKILKGREHKGIHNYCGSNNRNKPFIAYPSKAIFYVNKNEGVIETDKIFEYIEGSEGTIQYSIFFKVYGKMRYKYQRGFYENTEIYSYYDYDTDLFLLLDRVKSFYEKLNID